MWVRAVGDVLRTAPAERLAARRARVAVGPATPSLEASRAWSAVLAAPSLLVPIMFPMWPEPMSDLRPSILGLPADAFILGSWAVIAAGLGVVLFRAHAFVWRMAAGVALNVLLVPVLVGPALALLLLKLAS